jgi:hypothetical protein
MAGLPIRIIDGFKNFIADVRQDEGEGGLIVYTKPRYRTEGVVRAFFNPTIGINMNVDGSSSPTLTENVHNGGDNAYWTGSAITGTWDFASTAQAKTGTQSIDATGTVNNDQARLDKGSTLGLSSYTVVSGWIYITNWAAQGTKEVRLQFEDAAQATVGNAVDMSNYIDTTVINAWQRFIIPLVDFNAASATVQSLIVTTIDLGGQPAPDYYLDDVQITNATAGTEFTLEPQAGEKLFITNIKVLLEDVYNESTTVGGHPIALDSFMGVPALSNGITFAHIRDESVIFNFLFTNLRDAFRSPNIREVESGNDGTNTWLAYNFKIDNRDGLLLDSKLNDKLVITIRDDLTGLTNFTNIANGYLRINE